MPQMLTNFTIHAFRQLRDLNFPDLGKVNLLIGNALAIYVNMFAVFKRKLHMLVLFSLFNPFYWVLHSIASFKALGQLFTRPYYWEKTTHGLTRHGTVG